MTPHFRRYSLVYLHASIFVTVAFAAAFVQEFKGLTQEQIDRMTWIQWTVMAANVVNLAGTVVLAFLNQSISRAKTDPRPTPPPPP